jgi:hypothetical protein
MLPRQGLSAAAFVGWIAGSPAGLLPLGGEANQLSIIRLSPPS